MNWADIGDGLWKATLLIISGMLLLRLGGRNSISQMTIPTTVIMVSIGTIIVQPIANKSVWMALASAAIFILILVTVEALQIRWNWFERIFRGPSISVILEGKLQPKELRKLRLTVDQLEMKLRQSGISRLQDVKTATVEPNGQLGYELYDDAKPVTLKQLKELLATHFPSEGWDKSPSGQADKEASLFKEVKGKAHSVSNNKLH